MRVVFQYVEVMIGCGSKRLGRLHTQIGKRVHITRGYELAGSVGIFDEVSVMGCSDSLTHYFS